jgi:hypothetical protein
MGYSAGNPRWQTRSKRVGNGLKFIDCDVALQQGHIVLFPVNPVVAEEGREAEESRFSKPQPHNTTGAHAIFLDLKHDQGREVVLITP